MRTMRLSLVGTVILMLVAGMNGFVAAQDDGSESLEPGGVVITQTNVDGTEPPSHKEPGAAFAITDGAVFHGTWDATDPRLSGAATYTGRWQSYPFNENIQLEAVAMTVANDEGRWVGTGRGIWSAGAEFGDNLWLIMEGEEAYEGLTAYLTVDIAHEEGTYRGFIFADELPTFPEPTE